MRRILDEEGNPRVGQLLIDLRDVERQTDRQRFRHALIRLGEILAYEISKELPRRDRAVTTPLGVRNEPVLAEPPVLGMILRAAMPLWEGLLNGFPESDSLVLGAARREGRVANAASPELEVDLDYSALVPLEGKTLIYVDPMIATGSTLRKIHPRLIERAGRPDRVIIAGAIGVRATLERLAEEFACDTIVASADDELNEHGYIIPGLGDAGDLVFGKKIT